MSEKIVRIEVQGLPHAQPRPRFMMKRVVSTASKKVQIWRERILQECRQILRDRPGLKFEDEPITAKLRFQFGTKIQSRWGQDYMSKPDTENLIKPVLDEIEKSGMIDNDSHVTRLDGCKIWAAPHQAGMVCILSATTDKAANFFLPEDFTTKPEWLDL